LPLLRFFPGVETSESSFEKLLELSRENLWLTSMQKHSKLLLKEGKFCSGKGGEMAKSLYANPNHMAIIVRDIDKAINYYQSLGMGPFVTPPPVNIKKRTDHGKAAVSGGSKIKEAIGDMGTVRVQLIQPVEGKSIYQEFLDSKGEGVHHYAFIVDDIEKVEAEFVSKGVEILSSVRLEGGGGHIIVNTAVIGGILIELMQPPAEWLKRSAFALRK